MERHLSQVLQNFESLVGRTSSSGTGTLSPSTATAVYVTKINSTSARGSSKSIMLGLQITYDFAQ